MFSLAFLYGSIVCGQVFTDCTVSRRLLFHNSTAVASLTNTRYNPALKWKFLFRFIGNRAHASPTCGKYIHGWQSSDDDDGGVGLVWWRKPG